jgi:acetyltransferase-like isoleucine patch superfamily enzyme
MIQAFAGIRGGLFTLYCSLFRRNIRIGRGLRLYRKISITGTGTVRLGRNCIVGGVRGDSSQYVTLDTHSEEAVIRIGDDARLFAARISSKYGITVGSGVLIEEAGLVDTDFHSLSKKRGAPENESKERCAIVIGDRVSIGARSFILKGVKVGDEAVIMPGSIVNGPVGAGAVVCGNPARAARTGNQG